MTNRRSHTPFRLVQKSTTLDDLEWPIRTLLQKRCLSDSTTKIWMKTGTYYQQQKCRAMALSFWRYKVYADIHGGSLERGIKRQWGCQERQFSTFSLAIFPETFEIRPTLLYSHTQSIVSFSVIPKCMTLNDLQWVFRVKFCFHAGLAASDCAISKIIAWKLIKIDLHTVSSAKIWKGL